MELVSDRNIINLLLFNLVMKSQDKVAKFMKDNNMDNPVEYRFLDLISEIGEVAKEMIKMTDYGIKKSKFRKEIVSELGDTFYSLIALANYYDVDLEEALNQVLTKYSKRIKKGGHSGSDNE
jgi:NTP pyrophosphatase (non-canonical NTP hydrolase)